MWKNCSNQIIPTKPTGIENGELFLTNAGGALARLHIRFTKRPAVDNGQTVHHTRPSRRKPNTRKTHHAPHTRSLPTIPEILSGNAKVRTIRETKNASTALLSRDKLLSPINSLTGAISVKSTSRSVACSRGPVKMCSDRMVFPSATSTASSTASLSSLTLLWLYCLERSAFSAPRVNCLLPSTP